jgi:sugar phosphate isomerase/epimerase
MDRRTFVAAAGASLIPLLAGCAPRALAPGSSAIAPAKLDRIAVTGTVFRANFDGWEHTRPAVMPRLGLLDYPAFIRDRFGVRKLELWSPQIALLGEGDETYRRVRAAVDAAGMSVVNLQVEGTPSLNTDTPADRNNVVQSINGWLDRARLLGAGAARVNVTRQSGPINLPAVIDILRRAADYGQSIGVHLLIENHGGYTASIPDMIALIQAVDHEYCKITIDWGDWNPPGSRYDAMQAAMPYTHIVSAKGYEFDPVSYEHSAYDVARLVRNAEAGGFRGVYSIDFWGPNHPADTERALDLFIRSITDNLV